MENEKELIDLFNGKDEVELTDDLIIKLVEDKKWKDVDSLKQLALMGARWNVKRNSIVL